MRSQPECDHSPGPVISTKVNPAREIRRCSICQQLVTYKKGEVRAT